MSIAPFKMKSILKFEEPWCRLMGYFNPYLDPFEHHMTSSIPSFDGPAYEKYPMHNFVYDKLWVAQTQGLKCGNLSELQEDAGSVIFPIFIKPRWGHLSASSKNCFRISSASELEKYISYKDMMWSEFIDGTEGMTDFIILKGSIVHQVTYVYSDEQQGFSEEWKLISSDSEPPQNIVDWVKDHMRGFTGVVNVQYRKNKIIEVSLRLARGGAYIVSAKNPDLLQNIRNVVEKNFWDFSLQNKMGFEPYYTFKCFTNFPIVYLFPQHVLDFIVRTQANRPFYEYYFEPVGKKGMVFLQFMHDDLEEGLKIKRRIEALFIMAQFVMYILLVSVLVVLFSKWNFKYYYVAIVVAVLLTRYLNPMVANYSLYKGQKQQTFGGGPSNNEQQDDSL
jgi:hypothetical protein